MNATKHIHKFLKISKKAGHAGIRKLFAAKDPLKKDWLELKDFRRKGVTIEEFLNFANLSWREARGMKKPLWRGLKNTELRTKNPYNPRPILKTSLAKGKSLEIRWANVLKRFDPAGRIYTILGASHFDNYSTIWQTKKENCNVNVTCEAGKYSNSCKYTKYTYSFVCSPHVNLRKAPEWVRNNAGMVALWADKGMNPPMTPNEEYWEVIWVRKGQGISLKQESGFILRNSYGTAHGKTLAACRGVLKKRENECKFADKERRLREMLEKNQLSGYSNISVSVADSVKAGNCREGTESFRDRYFS